MKTMTSEHTALTILGVGYVGQALLRHFPTAAPTRRRALPPASATFDLHNPDTWDNPPLAGRTVVWTFPAEPLAHVQAFHAARLKDAAGLIVLGSTSAYRLADEASSSDLTVTEESPLDMNQPRVQGEEWLRERGATVLRLAGIIGPGRDPVGWLRKGLIRDGAKLVNLIHVDDIVAVIAHLLAHPQPGARISVANGEPLPWRELVARFKHDGRLPGDFVLAESQAGACGKRVDAQRLRRLLPEHQFMSP
ncbi:MAG: hypothetical protein IT488_09395 [Gammaproteobacteria bacterium]|nr:hypothetical protein [Gammaproteobacteria bacterium]